MRCSVFLSLTAFRRRKKLVSIQSYIFVVIQLQFRRTTHPLPATVHSWLGYEPITLHLLNRTSSFWMLIWQVCCIPGMKKRTIALMHKIINFFFFFCFYNKSYEITFVRRESATAKIHTQREIWNNQRTLLLRSTFTRLVQGQLKTFKLHRLFFDHLSRD